MTHSCSKHKPASELWAPALCAALDAKDALRSSVLPKLTKLESAASGPIADGIADIRAELYHHLERLRWALKRGHP